MAEGNGSGPAACNVSRWNESESLLIGSTQVICSSVGILSSLAAIVLVLIARAYKEFIQRLFLYLAIAATFVCTLLLCNPIVLIINPTITDVDLHYLQTAISLPLAYFLMVYSLLLCSIGVYVASLTMGARRSAKSTRYEVIGLAIVTITPLIVTCGTMPLILDHDFCDNATFVFTVMAAVGILSVLLATISVGAVICQLCLKCNSTVHVRAIKEAMPLLVFVAVHQIAALFLLIYVTVLLSGSSMEAEFPVVIVALLFSFPVFFVSIPLILLCQPRVRHGIRCKKKRNRQHLQSVGVWNPSTKVQHVTSQTHYIVPPETSLTEQDTLVIKQY